MKTVSARQANHDFSELLSRVERGEEILITKRSKPVALLSPYHPPRLTPERQAAIDHAIEMMAQGLSWGTLILEPHSSTYRFPIALTGLISPFGNRSRWKRGTAKVFFRNFGILIDCHVGRHGGAT